MITRSLALRHGRVAIPRPATTSSIRQWRRALSSTTRKAAQEQQEAAQSNNGADGLQQRPQDRISADWEFFQHQRALTGNVGADVAPHYKPSHLLTRPPRPEDITLELLLASQTHLGHRTSLWHPANARYIFGTWGQKHDAIHVISLDVTAAHLRRACKVVSGVASKGGLILFVGTRDGQALTVVRAASLAGGCHLFDKWTPGTLTNAQQILGKCAKKVVNEKDEEIPGFESQLSSRAAIKPDLVVCLNPLENYVLLHECGIHNIPTIGIIDTDANPTWVTYPIPANDDSLRSVSIIAGALGKAGEAGQKLRLERARAGAIDYAPSTGLRVPTLEEVQASKRLKDHLSSEDRDDDEGDLLTPEEVALYTADEAFSGQPALEQAEVDDVEQLPQESDETLVGLTDFAEDKGDASELSQEELVLLAKSVQRAPVDSAAEDADVNAHRGTGTPDTPETATETETIYPQMTEEEELALLAESVQHPSNEQIAASHGKTDEVVPRQSETQATSQPTDGDASSDAAATSNEESSESDLQQEDNDKKSDKV